MPHTLHLGDCLDILRTMPDNSVDAVVTDPPYGLSFMGKRWDYDVPSQDIWSECLRVLKPGGHLLAFAGTRTQHRMAVRIEDAGFEIRDMIAWLYGSGFPKSLDVSKAIDKAAGAKPTATGLYKRASIQGKPFEESYDEQTKRVAITAPATDAAKQWHGWGTALKPALEPITVARKPLIGTVAENVLTWGTGVVNVDGCRVEGVPPSVPQPALGVRKRVTYGFGMGKGRNGEVSQATGRWPANLIHDGSEEVLGLFPETKAATGRTNRADRTPFTTGESLLQSSMVYVDGGGSAARFFYCAKASKADRGDGNAHPTVKPTDLMRYLCRLVTPPDGTVLDPFMGSGSTGKAAVLEGFNFIGIEREAEYLEIARARITHAQEQKDSKLL